MYTKYVGPSVYCNFGENQNVIHLKPLYHVKASACKLTHVGGI